MFTITIKGNQISLLLLDYLGWPRSKFQVQTNYKPKELEFKVCLNLKI